jgi:hypothetical protein
MKDQQCYTGRTEANLSRLDVVVMATGAVLMLTVFVLMLTLPSWG